MTLRTPKKIKDVVDLRKLKKMLSRSRKGRSVISVDSQWLKILHVSGKGRNQKIDFLKALRIHDMEDIDIVRTLEETLTEAGIETDGVAVSNSSHFTRARVLRLPSTDPKELKVMIDLQVEKHTPDNKEETLTYFRPIRVDDEGYSQLLLVMSHQDVVNRTVRFAQHLKGNLLHVGADIDGYVNWYKKQVKLSGEKTGDGGTLLIDVDAESTSLLVMCRTEAYYHRSIPLGMNSLLEDDAESNKTNRFLGEILRSKTAFEDEGFKIVCRRVILTGLSARVVGLKEKVEREMKLTVTSEDPFEAYLVKEQAEEYAGNMPPVSFTAMAGFMSAPPVGDLMPPSVRLRRAFEKRVRASITLGAQFLLGLILLTGFFLKTAHQKESYRSYLAEQVDSLENDARQVNLALEHLSLVKERFQNRGRLLDSVFEIKNASPPSVQWDTFTFQRGSGVTLKGISNEAAKVFEMVSELEKSELFINPKARRVTKRKVDNKDVTAFEIVTSFFELP